MIQFIACKRRHEEHIEVSRMMHKTDLQHGKFAGRSSSIPYSPPRDNNNFLAKNDKRTIPKTDQCLFKSFFCVPSLYQKSTRGHCNHHGQDVCHVVSNV